MEDAQHQSLGIRAQVDQHVAATDQIQVCERRVFEHIVLCKDTLLAHLSGNAIAAVLSIERDEESLQALRRERTERLRRIDPGPSASQSPGINIGGKELKRKREVMFLQKF